MKLVKSLLLGSAATIAAAAGAQAADLPSMKSAPVQYVQICDAYGAGFFYIPGTDVCLHVGGIVRAEYIYDTTGNTLALSQAYKQSANTTVVAGSTLTGGTAAGYTQAYQASKAGNTVGSYIRGYISVDARDQTAYGTLRAYVSLAATNAEGDVASGLNANNAFASPSATTTSYASGNAATSVTLINSIVQFDGITAGRANSLASFYRNANQIGGTPWEFGNSLNLLAYTATFGNGVSATVSVEDPSNHDVGVSGLDQNIANYAVAGFLPVAAATAGSVYGHQGVVVSEGPFTMPDVDVVLRVDQAWGSAQIAGAIHRTDATAIAGTALAGEPVIGGSVPGVGTPATLIAPQSKSTTGYGIVGGVEFNLPQLAAGDQLWLEAAYADGALNYAGLDNSANGNLTIDADNATDMPLVPGFQRFDRDAFAVENASGTGFTLAKESAWSGFFDLLHHWTPQWSSNLYGSYAQVYLPAAVKNTDWTEGGLGNAHAYRVGANIIWTPVAGFYIGLDVMYSKLYQTMASNPGSAPTALPAGVAQNPDGWTTTLHLQRSF